MTHQSVEDSDAAVPADLVPAMLSCGVEDPQDLVADLRQAVAAAVHTGVWRGQPRRRPAAGSRTRSTTSPAIRVVT